ncbi:site-specific integrase, partial [Streptomyces sp. MBT57]|nr:site-specific integrase [Streptomyces sp. MBT57]
MELHYIKPGLLDRWHPGVGPSAVEVRAMLDEGVVKDGTPLFLDAQMVPIEYLSGWFRQLSMRNRDAKTMRQYAYLVRSLVHFLEGRGTDVRRATEADLTAFRRSRSELQEVPVEDRTWDRDAGVIDRLYGWLRDNGHIERRPIRLDGNGRNPLASGITRGMDIRHFGPDQYLYFRDVGLGGQLPDASMDPLFRGWYPHRSKAGLESALLTGMRKQEWSTTMLPELGFFDGYRPVGSVEFDLQACAKYGMHRVVYVPVAARAMVEIFFMLEREEIADASARSLARRARDLFVVTDFDRSTSKLTGTYQGRRRVFTMSAMGPEMRRVAVFERDGGGLEAMAIFIGHGGLMIGPSSWDAIRKDAWTRMIAHAGHPSAPQLPRKMWRFHDA